MAAHFHDFDAAWADEDDEPVVLKLLGEEWKCKRPSEVPAGLLLKLDRLLAGVARSTVTGEALDDSLVVDEDLSTESIVRQMAGDDNVDAWLARGLGYQRLAEVSRYLNLVYHGQDPGKAPAANRRARRAAARPGSASKTS